MVLDGNKATRQRGKERAKEFLYMYLLTHPCADCGIADVSVLTFDYIPGTKKYNMADMIQHGYGIATILKEIEKTDVVCFNCHSVGNNQGEEGKGLAKWLKLLIPSS